MTPLRLHHKIEKQKLELKANLNEDGLQVWVFFLEIMEETSIWFRLLEVGFANVYLNLLNPFFFCGKFSPHDDSKKCLANGLKDFEPQNPF
jgi:hypothetical protein